MPSVLAGAARQLHGPCELGAAARRYQFKSARPWHTQHVRGTPEHTSLLTSLPSSLW